MEQKIEILMLIGLWAACIYYSVLLQKEDPIQKKRLVGLIVFATLIVLGKILYEAGFWLSTVIQRHKRQEQ